MLKNPTPSDLWGSRLSFCLPDEKRREERRALAKIGARIFFKNVFTFPAPTGGNDSTLISFTEKEPLAADR